VAMVSKPVQNRKETAIHKRRGKKHTKQKNTEYTKQENEHKKNIQKHNSDNYNRQYNKEKQILIRQCTAQNIPTVT
jgi:uncharacterized membrane protein YdbT with pleckstrin-like domain